MNLSEALKLDSFHISELRDLAGALRKDPLVVDWELCHDLLADSLGCMNLAQCAAAFFLDPMAQWDGMERKALCAVIRSSTVKKVEVDAWPDGDRWIVRCVKVHGVALGREAFTQLGLDECAAIAAQDAREDESDRAYEAARDRRMGL